MKKEKLAKLKGYALSALAGFLLAIFIFFGTFWGIVGYEELINLLRAIF